MDVEQQIDALIDESYADENLSRPRHEKIVALLDQTDLKTLSPDLLFKAAQYLQDAVLGVAALTGRFIQQKNNAPAVVDEAHFEEEVAQLLRISASLDYSRALKKYLRTQRQSVADYFNTAAFRNIQDSVPGMNHDEQLDYVRHIMYRTIEAHADPDLPLPMPDISLRRIANANAITTRFAEGPEGQITDKMYVDVGEETLNSPILHLLAYHETVHILILRFAAAAERGQMKPAHPFFNDASLRLSQFRNRYNPAPSIRSHYDADPEETMVYGLQNYLEKLTKNPATNPVHKPVEYQNLITSAPAEVVDSLKIFSIRHHPGLSG